MHRLFVALRPPPSARAPLLAAMGGVLHARWQRDDQLHLTLRFIGEVDRHQAEDIAAVLGTIHHPRFALALDGIGQFERKGRIDSLWVGVSPLEQVRALHLKIDQALSRAGVPREGRAFLPHITLARFSKAAGAIDGLAPMLAGVRGLAFALADFRLYESALGPDGADYSTIARYPLD